MKKILIAAMIVFFAATKMVAQEHFKIGAPLPDFTLDTIINFAKNKTSISEFKGKHLIIDFWGTFCAPCIADIPKMEKMQERYKDSLYVLMVGADGYDRAKNFYAIRKRDNKPIKLASAHNRTIINYFGIKQVPQYAWIDNNGIVRALTDDSQLTEKNLADFLAGRDFRPRMFKGQADTMWSFKGKHLLTVANEMDSANVLYTSAFTKYLPGIVGSYRYPKDDKATRIDVRNQPIALMYRLAFADSGQSAIIYSMCDVDNDEEEYLMPKRETDWDTWKINNTYCYELTVPVEKSSQLRAIMKQDLDRFFTDVDAHWEMRKKEVYVLVADRKPTFFTGNGKPNYTLHGAGGATIVNQPFSRFFNLLWHYNQTRIFIDETNIKGNIDLSFRAQMTDIESLNTELAKFGLHLRKEERDMRILVVRKKRN